MKPHFQLALRVSRLGAFPGLIKLLEFRDAILFPTTQSVSLGL